MGKYKDLTGQMFGNLRVLYRVENSDDGKVQWLCECQCEDKTQKKIVTSKLTLGRTKSCGCLTQDLRISSLHKNYINEYKFDGDTCIIIANNTKREFYIDAEDYDKIKDYAWYETKRGYLATTINRKTIMLHRVVMGLIDTDEGTVDHIYHTENGENSFTNNHKYNLRIITQEENTRNHGLSSANTSGKTGVSWIKKESAWKAYINFKGKRYNLGTYQNLQDAVNARVKAEEKYFKEFNFKREEDEDYEEEYDVAL
jgi:hypothetical protein